MRLSRRHLLQLSTLACSFCCDSEPGASAQTRNQDDSPKLEFPARPRDRLAVTSYPFRAFIESPTNRGRNSRVTGFDLREFPRIVAERFSVYNINPLIDHFSSTERSYLESFRQAVAKAGSHVVDLGLPQRPFAAADAGVASAAIGDGCKWIDIAAAIGSPSVRQHLSVKHGEKPDFSAAVKNLSRLAEYGRKRNVVVNLENDDPVAEDPFFIVKVIEAAGTPYLRALPDFGNSLAVYDVTKNDQAMGAMLKHAFNMCHVKDSVQTDSGKTCSVDLGKMFAMARQSAYRGYFSMEYEFADPFAGTKKLIDETLHYLI